MRILILIVIAIMLAACGEYALDQTEQMVAENGGHAYAGNVGAKLTSCSGTDSDRDGYVTCGVIAPNGEREAIVCGYKAKGCKHKDVK